MNKKLEPLDIIVLIVVAVFGSILIAGYGSIILGDKELSKETESALNTISQALLPIIFLYVGSKLKTKNE